jgi:hypothetical protein
MGQWIDQTETKYDNMNSAWYLPLSISHSAAALPELLQRFGKNYDQMDT